MRKIVGSCIYRFREALGIGSARQKASRAPLEKPSFEHTGENSRSAGHHLAGARLWVRAKWVEAGEKQLQALQC